MNDILVKWPAPSNIAALTTTRMGGASKAPFTNNNLALHVGDDVETVTANRQWLKSRLLLPREPVWLEQTHTNVCVLVEQDKNRHADAAVTRTLDYPLVIMTADCLPLLLCNRQGTEIAAVHSGWRGMANGVIENTLQKMESRPEELLAWVGPAICQVCYEVGDDVRQAYTSRYPFTEIAFVSKGTGYLANLPKLAELVLNSLGINAVFQSGACTFEQQDTFYSYRRAAKTGRMATLIWLKNAHVSLNRTTL